MLLAIVCVGCGRPTKTRVKESRIENEIYAESFVELKFKHRIYRTWIQYKPFTMLTNREIGELF